jgi:N-methylhydantoinase A
MLLADERHDFIRTYYADLASVDFGKLIAVREEMIAEAQAGLRHTKGAEQQLRLDLRYTGQEFTLPVPVTLAQLKKGDRRGIRIAFDKLYEQRYAHHSPDEPVEMVNIRLTAVGQRPKLEFPKKRSAKRSIPRRRLVHLGSAAKPVACPIYARDTLSAGTRIAGPALIEEHGTTTVIYAGDRCRVAPSGELIIAVGGGR